MSTTNQCSRVFIGRGRACELLVIIRCGSASLRLALSFKAIVTHKRIQQIVVDTQQFAYTYVSTTHHLPLTSNVNQSDQLPALANHKLPTRYVFVLHLLYQFHNSRLHLMTGSVQFLQ